MTDRSITGKDNGKGIHLMEGETVTVTLDEPKGSDYVWTQDLDYDNILKLEKVEEEDQDERRSRNFLFTATQPGFSSISLKLWRQSDDAVAERYIVAVQVGN
jgi:predicted secreted protein